MRNIIGIQKVAAYLGRKSNQTTYTLVQNDPDFAALFFRIGGSVVCYEDELIATLERRRETHRAYAIPPRQPPRRRGRPRKHPLPEQPQPAAE